MFKDNFVSFFAGVAGVVILIMASVVALFFYSLEYILRLDREYDLKADGTKYEIQLEGSDEWEIATIKQVKGDD